MVIVAKAKTAATPISNNTGDGNGLGSMLVPPRASPVGRLKPEEDEGVEWLQSKRREENKQGTFGPNTSNGSN